MRVCELDARSYLNPELKSPLLFAMNLTMSTNSNYGNDANACNTDRSAPIDRDIHKQFSAIIVYIIVL